MISAGDYNWAYGFAARVILAQMSDDDTEVGRVCDELAPLVAAGDVDKIQALVGILGAAAAAPLSARGGEPGGDILDLSTLSAHDLHELQELFDSFATMDNPGLSRWGTACWTSVTAELTRRETGAPHTPAAEPLRIEGLSRLSNEEIACLAVLFTFQPGDLPSKRLRLWLGALADDVHVEARGRGIDVTPIVDSLGNDGDIGEDGA